MWPSVHIFFRPNQQADTELIQSVRDVLAHSLELLRANPQPDTFLGRKTHEPFPKQKDAD